MIQKCSLCKRVRVTDENNIWQPFKEVKDPPKDCVDTICPMCKPVDEIRHWRIEDTAGRLHP